MRQQTTDRVIMIRPVGFGYDPETAESNAFQKDAPDPEAIKSAAMAEFKGLVKLLRSKGVTVLELDPIDPNAPNAVFPNNWFSTHDDGRLVVYPMATPSRRVERDPGLAERVNAELLDLSASEEQGEILEGTGSMVLDRVNKIAYACTSPRTTITALGRFCVALDFQAFHFRTTVAGTEIYHTNVMMSVGTSFAVICTEAILDPTERQAVLDKLASTGKQVIEISLEQMHLFAGNILELWSKEGKPLIAMSSAAFNAFTLTQRELLATFGELIHAPIPTIEKVGGGSVRCMLAENFLPLRT